MREMVRSRSPNLLIVSSFSTCGPCRRRGRQVGTAGGGLPGGGGGGWPGGVWGPTAPANHSLLHTLHTIQQAVKKGDGMAARGDACLGPLPVSRAGKLAGSNPQSGGQNTSGGCACSRHKQASPKNLPASSPSSVRAAWQVCPLTLSASTSRTSRAASCRAGRSASPTRRMSRAMCLSAHWRCARRLASSAGRFAG